MASLRQAPLGCARDIKNKLPNTTSTIFGIASGTKVFTALGIGVLVDHGLISLGTTVGEIDQEYTGFVDEHATIQHLLTHTSGIYDYYDEEVEQDYDHFSVEIPWCELETPSDYYPLFKGKAMKYRPGERTSYSNGGYVFLGMLIEKLTGMLYRDFVRERVLLAANMHNSGFYAFNDLPENTANGYLEDRRTTNIYQLPLRGGGEGGDAGVGFNSSHLPQEKLTINILSNITNGEEGMRQEAISLLRDPTKGEPLEIQKLIALAAEAAQG